MAPRQLAAALPTQQRPSVGWEAGIATILIVDDLSANRTLLATLLRNQGHRLLEAADGREGLATVQAEHPDLVITDVLMRVMDGYELMRQIRLDPSISRTPVLFYTASYGERDTKNRALFGGRSWVLTKPAQSREVLTVVNGVLSGDTSTGMPTDAARLTMSDSEDLRPQTDSLTDEAGDLRTAIARLRALINIGLALESERDSRGLLEKVCVAARDLFGATYVTLGILDPKDRTAQRVITCGNDGSGDVQPARWIRAGDTVTGVLGTVVFERRTVRGENPGGSPANLQLPALHPEIQTFVAAPLVSSAHVYGWLCLVGNEGRTFTEEEEHLILALSAQVGRFYERLSFSAIAQKRAEALEQEIVVRKRAESAVRRERDRAQRYLDTAEVILLKLDLEGRIALVNRYACSVLGWSADQLLGRDWVVMCLPVRTRDEFRGRFDNLVAGDSSSFEHPILTRSGEERLIEWRHTLLRDDEGRIVGTFSSGADITERHQGVDALRTAEERMRFALEAASVGIWDMNCATGVIRWSTILEAQYGLPPGGFVGTFEGFIERIHPDDRESVRETVMNAVSAGTDFSVHHRTLWLDGTVRWLSSAGRGRLSAHGDPVRAVGISLDVTERHALEAQYQQAQKMEAIGRLAGGVAHDFNNLLTVILGYCELLLVDLDTGDPRHADIAAIRDAGVRAAGLTRQLLAFSRKQIIEPTLLDLNVVMTQFRAMLGRLIKEDVEVVLVLQPGLASVKADRGQIDQVLMNLTMNARDAMPGGGTLTVKTANVELDAGSPTTHPAVTAGLYVMLTVTDTGTGMTAAVQARLFEPFFTTKEAGKGTGLGLATVHGIVARSGGTIMVDSEPGVGTTFTVYLPAADSVAKLVVDAPPMARTHTAGETVLVVEDAEHLRALTARLLRRLGYTVLVAANATEAARLFGANPSIDVLLTDVVMPGASGPELTQQLLEQRPALKVIYMSGYTESAITSLGILQAGSAFLDKPFTSETLEQKIREVLNR